mgnify:CR=1 FL=1
MNKTAELLEAEGMTLDDYTYDNKGNFMPFHTDIILLTFVAN